MKLNFILYLYTINMSRMQKAPITCKISKALHPLLTAKHIMIHKLKLIFVK